MSTTNRTVVSVRGPRFHLHITGMAILIGAIAAYAGFGSSWWTFAILFLVPDISMVGYFGGPRLGAIIYNIGHNLLGPVLCGVVATATGNSQVLLDVAIIWGAHIGFDWLLGYGFKYLVAFQETHYQRV